MYFGEFTDINGKGYQVIIENYNENTTELIFGDTPVTLEWENSEDIIYKPYKSSNCTVEVVNDSYLFDLYVSKATDRPIYINNSEGEVIWKGYITPNLYSQGYENPLETISIECIDGIGVLQYIDYKPVNENKGIVSFADILNNICKLAGMNNYVYPHTHTLTDNYGVEYKNLLNCLYIHENNFFDEDNKPLKYNEVLEQICQYLGYTAFCIKESLYLLDYKFIYKGNNFYYDNWEEELGQLVDLKEVTVDSYSTGSQNISLDNTYNKVTVIDSLYTIDEIFPDIYNSTDLYSYTSHSSNLNNPVDHYFKNNYWVTYCCDGKNMDNAYNLYTNFLKNPNVETFMYVAGRENEVKNQVYKYSLVSNLLTEPKELMPDDVKNYVFATYVNIGKEEYYNGDDFDDLGASTSLVLYQNAKCDHPDTVHVPLARIKHDTGALMLSTPFQKQGIILSANIEIFNYQSSYHPDSKIYERTDANGVKQDRREFFFERELSGHGEETIANSPMWFLPDNDKCHGKINRDDLYLRTTLQYGDLYYNGEEWVNTFSYFMIPISTGSDKELFEENEYYEIIDGYRWLRKVYNTDTPNTKFSIRNTIQWWQHIDKSGYFVPMPQNLYGDNTEIIITFYSNSYVNFYNNVYVPFKYSQEDIINVAQRTASIWIEDFKIENAVYDRTLEESDEFDLERMKDAEQSNDSDTEYSNVINEEYVSELDEIEFKICTWDNKKPNYSCVYYLDSKGGFNNLDTTTNIISGEKLRFEEHLIAKLVTQYIDPSKILELSLHNYHLPYSLFHTNNFPESYFILDGQKWDIKYNTNEVRLIEIK